MNDQAAAKPKIRAILIDCGEVIWDDCPHNHRIDEEVFRAIRDAGQDVTREAVAEAKQAGIAECDRVLHLGVLQRLLGRENPLVETIAAQVHDWNMGLPFDEYVSLNPLRDGCREALASLAEHFTLAVVANQPARAADLLKHYGLHRHFAFIGISEVMGLFKPDPAFYNAILAKIGVPAAEAAMIGDRYTNDIEPAHAVGMTTIRFACPNNPWLAESGRIRADHVVHSWEEVESVTQRLA